MVSDPWVVYNLVDPVFASLPREVVCTVSGQGEGPGQQGRIEVVSGALTGPWGKMDLGFLMLVLVAMTVHFLLYLGVLVLVLMA